MDNSIIKNKINKFKTDDTDSFNINNMNILNFLNDFNEIKELNEFNNINHDSINYMGHNINHLNPYDDIENNIDTVLIDIEKCNNHEEKKNKMKFFYNLITDNNFIYINDDYDKKMKIEKDLTEIKKIEKEIDIYLTKSIKTKTQRFIFKSKEEIELEKKNNGGILDKEDYIIDNDDFEKFMDKWEEENDNSKKKIFNNLINNDININDKDNNIDLKNSKYKIINKEENDMKINTTINLNNNYINNQLINENTYMINKKSQNNNLNCLNNELYNKYNVSKTNIDKVKSLFEDLEKDNFEDQNNNNYKKETYIETKYTEENNLTKLRGFKPITLKNINKEKIINSNYKKKLKINDNNDLDDKNNLKIIEIFNYKINIDNIKYLRKLIAKLKKLDNNIVSTNWKEYQNKEYELENMIPLNENMNIFKEDYNINNILDILYKIEDYFDTYKIKNYNEINFYWFINTIVKIKELINLLNIFDIINDKEIYEILIYRYNKEFIYHQFSYICYIFNREEKISNFSSFFINKIKTTNNDILIEITDYWYSIFISIDLNDKDNNFLIQKIKNQMIYEGMFISLINMRFLNDDYNNDDNKPIDYLNEIVKVKINRNSVQFYNYSIPVGLCSNEDFYIPIHEITSIDPIFCINAIIIEKSPIYIYTDKGEKMIFYDIEEININFEEYRFSLKFICYYDLINIDIKEITINEIFVKFKDIRRYVSIDKDDCIKITNVILNGADIEYMNINNGIEYNKLRKFKVYNEFKSTFVEQILNKDYSNKLNNIKQNLYQKPDFDFLFNKENDDDEYIISFNAYKIHTTKDDKYFYLIDKKVILLIDQIKLINELKLDLKTKLNKYIGINILLTYIEEYQIINNFIIIEIKFREYPTIAFYNKFPKKMKTLNLIELRESKKNNYKNIIINDIIPNLKN